MGRAVPTFAITSRVIASGCITLSVPRQARHLLKLFFHIDLYVFVWICQFAFDA